MLLANAPAAGGGEGHKNGQQWELEIALMPSAQSTLQLDMCLLQKQREKQTQEAEARLQR